MLDFTNKAFDKMSFSIKMNIVFSACSSAVATCRNHRFDTASCNSFDKLLTVVAFVGNQIIKPETGNQILCLPMIALFAAG